MKNTRINKGWCMAICMAATLSMASCEDWTEVESVDMHMPSIEEENAQLYADYLKDLNTYKQREHLLTLVSVDNVAHPTQQVERLTALPDSVDYICLNNFDQLSASQLQEIETVRLKGTRFVYVVDFNQIESEWAQKLEENSALTEEEADAYFTQRAKALLDVAEAFNYDGIIADYDGRSYVSLKGEELDKYTHRQALFMNQLKTWKEASKKTLFFYGNIQYLTADNLQLTSMFDHIILKTAASTNAGDLSVKALLAVQAGIDAFGAEANPVPVNHFMACVQLPQPDDTKKEIGYWNTLDADGNKLLASYGAAGWNVETTNKFGKGGVFILNAQTDYYNNTFAAIREVINRMNPSK